MVYVSVFLVFPVFFLYEFIKWWTTKAQVSSSNMVEPCFTQTFQNSLITGCQSPPNSYSYAWRQSKWPKTKGAGRDGKAEGWNRQKGWHLGSPGTLGWTGVPGVANSRVHEANILGAIMGCYGANLLLRYFNVLHGWIHILPQDLQRAFFWRLLSKSVPIKAEAPHENQQFWHCKVWCSPKSLLSQFSVFRTGSHFNWSNWKSSFWYYKPLIQQPQNLG